MKLTFLSVVLTLLCVQSSFAQSIDSVNTAGIWHIDTVATKIRCVTIKPEAVISILYDLQDRHCVFTFLPLTGSGVVVSFQKGKIYFMRSWMLIDDLTAFRFIDWNNEHGKLFVLDSLGELIKDLPQSLQDDLALLKK